MFSLRRFAQLSPIFVLLVLSSCSGGSPDRADDVTSNSATLRGYVMSSLGGSSYSGTTYWFEYGVTTTNKRTVSHTIVLPDQAGHPVAERVGGLSPGTTYRFQVCAQDGDQSTPVCADAPRSFTTSPAPPTCTKVAAPSGSDSSAGTAAAPYKTAQKLVDSLAAGQTGCLRGGTYPDGMRIDTPDVSVTSYPGERATVLDKVYLTKNADRVTVSDLNLVSSSGTGQFVNGSDDVFKRVDVTSNNTENCFIVGSEDPEYGRAERLVIENSRIHNCGQLDPDTNGDHGIYIAHADDTVIRDNWIYDNADRGVQLYPDSAGAQVYRNVIDGNGSGLIVNGDGSGPSSSSNSVHDNVISNSRGNGPGTAGWNVDVLVGTANTITGNCVFATNSDPYYNTDGGIEAVDGNTVGGNRVADPRFVSRVGKDFHLPSDSPCAYTNAGIK